MDGNVDVHSCTCKRDWHGRLLFAESISGFYSFGMHLDITSYYQKMKRMGEKNHSSDRHLDQEVQAKCVCVFFLVVCVWGCMYVCVCVSVLCACSFHGYELASEEYEF